MRPSGHGRTDRHDIERIGLDSKGLRSRFVGKVGVVRFLRDGPTRARRREAGDRGDGQRNVWPLSRWRLHTRARLDRLVRQHRVGRPEVPACAWSPVTPEVERKCRPSRGARDGGGAVELYASRDGWRQGRGTSVRGGRAVVGRAASPCPGTPGCRPRDAGEQLSLVRPSRRDRSHPRVPRRWPRGRRACSSCPTRSRPRPTQMPAWRRSRGSTPARRRRRAALGE